MPNILLVMTDQQRGDAMGCDRNPVIQTPYLDSLAATGFRFRCAYSACPTCIPARRTLMTGTRPATHGALINYAAPLDFPTLPGVLSQAGYQTHLVGKLHLWPERKLHGFHSADWADGPNMGLTMSTREHDPQAANLSRENDYIRFLRREAPHGLPAAAQAHGMDGNWHIARPWHLEEHLHFSNWCADRAIDFLERRDPTRPFFLKLSFFHPHSPCTPPSHYFNMYLDAQLPEPPVGAWVDPSELPANKPVAYPRARLTGIEGRHALAGYYGSITHLDHQLGRVLRVIPEDTVVLFTSDHGDMLGDHLWTRKTLPYEGSARVPLLVRFPKSFGLARSVTLDQPVELMDIMPTLLDAAGADVPKTVEGRSLMPLCRGDRLDWRPYLHGEHAHITFRDGPGETGMQYLTDGKRKYVWFPAWDRQQLFDLTADPDECRDLSADPAWADELTLWRSRLVCELAGRPEGFVRDRCLVKQDGPTAYYLGT